MSDLELHDQLTTLRAEVDAIARRIEGDPPVAPAAAAAGPAPRPHRRRRRLGLALAVLALAIAVPGAVLASHQFTDVPDSHTFHANIGNIRTAGITSGCGGTKYCPSDPVTRGSMAGFLNRGLGRGAVFTSAENDLGDVPAVVLTGHISTPGAGFILATASAMGYTSDTTGCPCVIDLTMYTDDESSFFFADTLDNAGGETFRFVSLANTYMFGVASSGSHAVTVEMARDGTADVGADVALTLVWIPFDEAGTAFSGFPAASHGQVVPH